MKIANRKFYYFCYLQIIYLAIAISMSQHARIVQKYFPNVEFQVFKLYIFEFIHYLSVNGCNNSCLLQMLLQDFELHNIVGSWGVSFPLWLAKLDNYLFDSSEVQIRVSDF